MAVWAQQELCGLKELKINVAKRDSRLWRLVLPLLFSLREIYLLNKHELWRDELQAWLIAYQSHSPSDLLRNLQYEGRPPLWHLLIWILNQFTSNPESLKILTFVIYVATVFILYSLKSISILFKILISLGFYFFYGYSIVSRDYNLILLLCLVLLFLNEKLIKRNYEYIICILLSLTNPFGSVIAIYWILLHSNLSLTSPRKLFETNRTSILKILPILAFVLYFRMPHDSVFQPNFHINPRKIVTSFSAVFTKPFLPYSDTHQLNLLDMIVGVSIVTVLAFFVFSIERKIRIALMIAVAMLTLNALIGYSLYWWHFGASFLLFLIAFIYQFQQLPEKRKNNFLTVSVSIILMLQIFGSINGIGRNFQGDSNYSNIRKTAEYIAQKYPGATVISESQVFGTPLYAYLKPEKIYFPSIQDYSYFTSWKKTEFRDVSKDELISAALQFKKAIIVTSYFPEIKDSRVIRDRGFTGAVWGDNFQIYEVVR